MSDDVKNQRSPWQWTAQHSAGNFANCGNYFIFFWCKIYLVYFIYSLKCIIWNIIYLRVRTKTIRCFYDEGHSVTLSVWYKTLLSTLLSHLLAQIPDEVDHVEAEEDVGLLAAAGAGQLLVVGLVVAGLLRAGSAHRLHPGHRQQHRQPRHHHLQHRHHWGWEDTIWQEPSVMNGRTGRGPTAECDD